jgi:hypothetical protein
MVAATNYNTLVAQALSQLSATPTKVQQPVLSPAIIVGFDGTHGARAALHAAIDLADTTNQPLFVVYVEEVPAGVTAGTLMSPGASALITRTPAAWTPAGGSAPSSSTTTTSRGRSKSDGATRPTNLPLQHHSTPRRSSSSDSNGNTASPATSLDRRCSDSSATRASPSWSFPHWRHRRPDPHRPIRHAAQLGVSAALPAR